MKSSVETMALGGKSKWIHFGYYVYNAYEICNIRQFHVDAIWKCVLNGLMCSGAILPMWPASEYKWTSMKSAIKKNVLNEKMLKAKAFIRCIEMKEHEEKKMTG